MIKFYGYKKCSTCRKAESFLQRAHIDYDFIDITEHPPTVEELIATVALSETPLRKFFNTSGVQYRELNIKDRLASLPDQEILTLLAENGRLIKRPVITDEKRATVGFDEEKFSRTWC
ncbi:MAG: arsenate reductase family protein [Nitrosomonas sp.]|nr:MAG: arsenate reductase family protein [Nitrosomonas sp.]